MNDYVPSEFYLGQNYPNPFSDKTTIKYCVAYKSRVVLTVYDSEGKVIKKLVDEEKSPGTYEIEFSAAGCNSDIPAERGGKNLPDGYYYYKMAAGEYTSGKKWFYVTNYKV